MTATVKTYINNIFSKLALRDRAQAVVYAVQTGLEKRYAGTRESRAVELSQAHVNSGHARVSGYSMAHGTQV
jgi:hypothetical protein